MRNDKLDKCVSINPLELAEWLAETECRKPCGQIAEELYRTRGKEFCVGVILHLTMYVSGQFDDGNSGGSEDNASKEERR